MNHKKLAITLTIVQSVIASKHITAVNKSYDTFDSNNNCEMILSSMNFLNAQRCVQFIFGYDFYSVNCAKKIMENAENVTFYIRSLQWLMDRNIYVEESSSNIMNKSSTKFCENFLFFVKDLFSLQVVLKAAKNNASFVTYMPYSKLYFILSDQNVQFSSSRLLRELSNFFYENAQFGYIYEVDVGSGKVKLLDFLSLNIEAHHTNQSNLMHPFVNRENNQKEFRVSFYSCSPYIIYVDEENLRFDGIEYRLVQEVTKNWNIKHLLRDESITGISPWLTMFEDLEKHTADLAMCSIWVSVFRDTYDVSSYYNHECNTLMIPKPERLSEITAIYTSFSGEVWLTFVLAFIATGTLLWGSAMIGERTVYVNLTRSFLEIMNIATSHGVHLFRTQRTSIKILLMSWIIASLSIGIYYVTVYTSRLSKPGYTKLIDTVEDFNENDMLWGSQHELGYDDIKSALNASSNPEQLELLQRIHFFKNDEDAESALATGKFGVLAGISDQKYFVTYEWNERLNLLESFRLMKKVCIFDYYIGFALQKFSPYKELFSHYALQYQEHGITHSWFSTVYRDKAWFDRFFEDHPRENNELVALKISSIIGALSVLFLSHILSLIIFICELATKKFHMRGIYDGPGAFMAMNTKIYLFLKHEKRKQKRKQN